jgi:fatty aldehyde-generating acyl-ACP reductase
MVEKFAFIIHPLGLNDIENFEKGAMGRPPELVKKVLEWAPPFKASHITGIHSVTGEEAEGWFIVCPLIPEQFMTLDSEFVVGKIVKACKVAEKLGAKVVGLGAFTAIAGQGGKEVASQVDIPVTTGNTYTTAVAIEATKEAAAIMGVDLKNASLAVVGATGSIGGTCAQIMAPEVGEIQLVGRNEQELTKIARKIKENTSGSANVLVSTDISHSVSQADVIITVTGAIDCVIHAEDIKPGAVVCDVARPRDVSKQVAHVRKDVLVIDGGIVKVPGEKVEFNFNFGPPKGMAEGCVAETIILALEKKYESYTIGKNISIEKVNEMSKLAQKHGFKLGALRRFEKAISSEEISAIKHNIFVQSAGA